MNHSAIIKLEIYRDLALLPEAELTALKILLDKIVSQAHVDKPAASLKGMMLAIITVYIPMPPKFNNLYERGHS